MPLADFIDAIRARGDVSFVDFPTVFWWVHGDAALVGGTVVGALLAIAALAGVRPRLCFALSTALYLSYATACRTFLSFQWDNLLLECGLLASFLPPGRASPLVHFLFRLVLFKLYFESGIAKWQSPIRDWHDGSAMTFYYETAPLPTFARLVGAQPARRLAPLREPRRAGAGAGRPLRDLRHAAAAPAVRGAVHRISDPEHRHRELRVLLLPRARAARLPARRRRRRARAARASSGGCPRLCGKRSSAVARPRARPRRPPPALRPRPRAPGAAAFIFISLLQGLFEFTDAGESLAVFGKVLEAEQPFRLDQHLSPVPGDHARAHRARIPDQHRRRAKLDRPRPAPQGRRPARARPTSSRPTSRASTSSSGSTGWRSSAASPRTSRCWSSGCATIPRRSLRCSGRRCPSTPTRCGSSTGATTSRPARSAARPAPGGGANRLARPGRFRAIDSAPQGGERRCVRPPSARCS